MQNNTATSISKSDWKWRFKELEKAVIEEGNWIGMLYLQG